MKVQIKSMKEAKSLKEWFSEKDFRAMSPEEQEQYLKDHPDSKFQPDEGGSKDTKDDKSKTDKDDKKVPDKNDLNHNNDILSNLTNLDEIEKLSTDKLSDRTKSSKERLDQYINDRKEYKKLKKILKKDPEASKEWDSINSELIKLSNRVMTDSNQELYKNCRNRRNEFCKSLGVNISSNFPNKPSQILDNFDVVIQAKDYIDNILKDNNINLDDLPNYKDIRYSLVNQILER